MPEQFAVFEGLERDEEAWPKYHFEVDPVDGGYKVMRQVNKDDDPYVVMVVPDEQNARIRIAAQMWADFIDYAIGCMDDEQGTAVSNIAVALGHLDPWGDGVEQDSIYQHMVLSQVYYWMGLGAVDFSRRLDDERKGEGF